MKEQSSYLKEKSYGKRHWKDFGLRGVDCGFCDLDDVSVAFVCVQASVEIVDALDLGGGGARKSWILSCFQDDEGIQWTIKQNKTKSFVQLRSFEKVMSHSKPYQLPQCLAGRRNTEPSLYPPGRPSRCNGHPGGGNDADM